jgi:hypothetical protein
MTERKKYNEIKIIMIGRKKERKIERKWNAKCDNKNIFELLELHFHRKFY